MKNVLDHQPDNHRDLDLKKKTGALKKTELNETEPVISQPKNCCVISS